MVEIALARAQKIGEAARGPVRQAEQPVGLREPGMILDRPKYFDGSLCLRHDRVSPRLVLVEAADQQPTQRRMCGERCIRSFLRAGSCLFDEDFGPGKLADLGHRLGQIREELKAIGVPLCRAAGAPAAGGSQPPPCHLARRHGARHW